MRTAVVVGILVAGCGGGGGTPQADGPGGHPDGQLPDIDAPVEQPDAAPCPSIDACGWLEDYQREIVSKLAGASEIAPGVTITRRASAMQRETTRTYLVAELTRWGYTPTLHQYSTGGANVVATLPATTGSGGTIVVGAHFDGVPAGPAAADNGTGTSVVLAAARYFATEPVRTHPITFVLFDQEEIGLVGSEAYAQKLIADAVTVDAVHNFDMISFDGDGDMAIELWSPSAELETAYRNVASPLGIPIQPVTFQFSDHQSFLDHGFTTVGVCEEYVGNDSTDYYHTSMDTYDKVNFTYLAMVTGVGVKVIRAAATE